MAYEIGSWVWVERDEEDVAVPGQLIEKNVVRLLNGSESLEIDDSQQLEALDPQCLDAKIDDLIQLNELTEKALLHVLRIRYAKDEIYTYVSDILLSVNPFKVLPIYTPQVLDSYIKQQNRKPHAYAVAAKARQDMLKDGKSQAILISGESGAGKTETTKLMLQLLAAASQHKNNTSGRSTLEQMILRSNPITEAFGNAKTLRNENSSRFGKWTNLFFSSTDSIIGSEIQHYLLEKSRVATQTCGERNYHCFYQLAECFDPAKGDKHNYISTSATCRVDDVADYDELLSCLTALKVEKSIQQALFEATTGVLFLGDLEFDEDTTKDAAFIVKKQILLKKCAPLLKCDAVALEESLIARTIGARSVVRTPLSAARARDARDAFAAGYQAIFDFVIYTINESLNDSFQAKSAENLTIGVLDIFGFEVFRKNGLEQLLINFTNEKLQFFFNETIFSNESRVYEIEGIPLDLVEFKNNEATLQLLESRRTGIFAMIDEEIAIPRGSDIKLASKIMKAHSSNTHFAKPNAKQGANIFGICHFAGDVFYDTTGFVEKNRDRLLDGLATLGESSTNIVVNTKFCADATANKKNKQRTVISKFKQQLNTLMTTLEDCAPHFVRCIKSNASKLPDNFHAKDVLSQMLYSGVLEVTRVRKAGFPYRISFDDFARKYHCCIENEEEKLVLKHSTNTNKIYSVPELCLKIPALNSNKESYRIGKTKIFLKATARDALDAARENALRRKVARFQAVIRGVQARETFEEYISIIHKLRVALAKDDAPTLDHFLEFHEYALLPHGGISLLVKPLICEAEKIVASFAQAKSALIALREASDARDIGKITASIALVKSAITNGQESTIIQEAEHLAQVLRAEPTIKQQLQDATSISQLEQALVAAEDLIARGGRISSSLITAAKDNLYLAKKQKEVSAALENAILSRDLEDLKVATQSATEFGVDCSAAKSLIQQLRSEHAAQLELEAAIDSREIHILDALLTKHRPILQHTELYEHAEKVSLEIHEEQAKFADLKSALDAALSTPNKATRAVLQSKLKGFSHAKETALLKEALDLEQSFVAEEIAFALLENACDITEKEYKTLTATDEVDEAKLNAMLSDQLEPALSKALKQRISFDIWENVISRAHQIVDICKTKIQNLEKERVRLKEDQEIAERERQRREKLIAVDKKLLDMVNQIAGTKQSINTYRAQREIIQTELVSAQQFGLNTMDDGVVSATRALMHIDAKLAAAEDLEQLYNTREAKHEDEVEYLQSEIGRLVIELSDVHDDQIKEKVEALRSTIRVLRSKIACREQLTKAMIDRDLDSLLSAKNKATELGISSDNYVAEITNELESARQAQNELTKAVISLRSALEAGTTTNEIRAVSDELASAIAVAMSRGLLEDDPLLCDAQKIQEQALVKKRALITLGRLMKISERSRDPTELENFLTKSNDSLGEAVLSCHPAIELLTTLQVEKSAMDRLRAADLALNDDDILSASWIELEAAVQAAARFEHVAATVEFSSLKSKVESHNSHEILIQNLRAALEIGTSSDDIALALAALQQQMNLTIKTDDISRLLQAANTRLEVLRKAEEARLRLEANSESDRLRREAETKAIERLKTALTNGGRESLTNALSAAYDLGTLYDADEVFAARKALRILDHQEHLLQAVDNARALCLTVNSRKANVDDELFALKSAVTTLSATIYAVTTAEDQRIVAAKEMLELSLKRISAVEHLEHILHFECPEPHALETIPLPTTTPAILESLRLAIRPAEEACASFGNGVAALVANGKQKFAILDEHWTAVTSLSSTLSNTGGNRTISAIEIAIKKLLDLKSEQMEESPLIIEARRVVKAIKAANAVFESSRAARTFLTKDATPIPTLKASVKKIHETMNAAQAVQIGAVEIENACREGAEVIAAVDQVIAARAVATHDKSLEAYPKLRTAADFVSRGLSNTSEKRVALDRRLKHQSVPLHRSLTAVSDALENEAKVCHRDILAFCGDIYMSYPEAMAADLLKRGFTSLRIDKEDDIHCLRDEIYLQLCKQLTDNPSGTSRYRCWRLLRLVSLTFAPSNMLKPLLESFAEDVIAVAAKGATNEVHALTAKSFLEILRSCKILYSTPPQADEIHALCFGIDTATESIKVEEAPSYQRLRRASINRKAAKLNDVAANLVGVELPDLMPVELQDVLKGETKDDEAVEAAYEQFEIMQHAAENKKRFLDLVEKAATALLAENGASETLAIDLEAQLSVLQTAKIPGLEVTCIIEAEELIARIYDQLDLIDSLLDAIQANSVSDLKAALSRAHDMDDARHLSLVKQAQTKLESLSSSSSSSSSFFYRLFSPSTNKNN